jgi:hypothetical protein
MTFRHILFAMKTNADTSPAAAVTAPGHTKGPWYLHHEHPANRGIVPAPAGVHRFATFRIDTPTGRIEVHQNSGQTMLMQEANMRLLVAAPELLTALRNLRKWQRQPWGPDDGAENEALILAADQAIAKATGGAK